MTVGGQLFSQYPYQIKSNKENKNKNSNSYKNKSYLAGDFKIGKPNFLQKNQYVKNFC